MNLEKLIETIIIFCLISPLFFSSITILLMILVVFGNIKALIILFVTEIYLIFFAKKSDALVRAIIKAKPEKYFKKF